MMQKKQICFFVGSDSCENSNLFLRKFYEELSHSFKMGWFSYSYREENNLVHMGSANFGEMSFDYKEKGKIHNIYIETDESSETLVREALANAKENYLNSLKTFTVFVKVNCDYVLFANMAKHNISFSYDKENEENTVCFSVQAFGKFDFKYVITQKINYLKTLLCAFSNCLFEIKKVEFCESAYLCPDVEWGEYNSEWIETSDLFETKNGFVLLPEFFLTFRKVLDDSFYEKDFRLILNAAQQLHCAQLLIKQYNSNTELHIPGYTDVIDTTLISVLEPISNIGTAPAEKCNECGQPKYSVRQKVLDLSQKYFSPEFAKKVIDAHYSDRSAFLHEGYTKTNEFYSGCSMPLIDYRDGRSVMPSAAFYDMNLLEYASFAVRKTIVEYLNDLH